MAREELFQEQTVSGFTQNPLYGLYYMAMEKSFSLVVGEAYTVSWEGEAYKVTAQDASSINDGAEMVAIGNGQGFGLSGNGEPFAIATTAELLLFFVMDPSDAAAEHRVGIWKGVDDAPIVLKDRDGSPVAYAGVERVHMMNGDGEVVEFIPAESVPQALEDIPVELDFSGGDQTILAPDGFLVKSAVLKKPEALVPENIAEGVNIAGVIGALAGGSGGGGNVAVGSFVGVPNTVRTIEHGLGVVPDIVGRSVVTYGAAAVGTERISLGISAKLKAKFGCDFGRNYYRKAPTNYASSILEDTIENSTGNPYATDTFVRFDSNEADGLTYIWFAIAGLT